MNKNEIITFNDLTQSYTSTSIKKHDKKNKNKNKSQWSVISSKVHAYIKKKYPNSPSFFPLIKDGEFGYFFLIYACTY